MTELFSLRPVERSRWDLVALGEVMLRLDPGEGRVSSARSFRVWEGGGEYNVARGLRKCFGLKTTVVTALADNPVGRLIEDLVNQGGVDTSRIGWVPYDGVGRTTRNGLNFTERGFGMRPALGCSDRGSTAASQLRRGDIDWTSLFEIEGARWFHTGGIFAGLSATTSDVVEEAMRAARDAGAVVSYDLNYRHSLWKGIGGAARAAEVNRRLVSLVDVVFGNEEDFTRVLGYEIDGIDPAYSSLDETAYAALFERVCADFPNVRLIASSLRAVRTATLNGWNGMCFANGRVIAPEPRPDIEILDRVGGGDSFASGLIYGLLAGCAIEEALEYGIAHGALAMTTPGDNSMATLAEVERFVRGESVRAQR